MAVRPLLERRARLRHGLRGFFDTRGFLEVDTPVLAAEVLPEAHIDPVAVPLPGRPAHYLQASPEALMKRLLARQAGPIYQFAHAFRAGERGPQHDLEFTLLEWYAPDTTLDDAASLLEALCAATLGSQGLERLTCADAFGAHAGVDPTAAGTADLEGALERYGCRRPEGEPAAGTAWDRAFEQLLVDVVQPRLGHGRPTLLEAWPASQGAFARLDPRDPRLARRFELFVAGVELANGWEEEPAREPLAARIAAANEVRRATGRPELPIPRRLLEAHGPGMPAGVGVALGFDRLAMLAAGAASIDAVRAFTSEA